MGILCFFERCDKTIGEFVEICPDSGNLKSFLTELGVFLGMEMILTGFSGMAIMAFVFVICYLRFGMSTSGVKKQLLILLLIAIFLRIGKSFVYYVLTDISDLAVAFGFLGFAMMGPLLYAFFRYSNGTSLLAIARREWVHLLFPVTGFVCILLESYYAVYPYRLGTLSFALYLTYILWSFRREGKQMTAWDRNLILLNTCISVLFLIQTFVPTKLLYVAGTGIASLLMSVWFTYILMNPLRLRKEVQPKSTQHTPEQARQVVAALREEKGYRQTDLTLSSFAQDLGIPRYLVSAIVKEKFGCSFPKAVNKLRIEEVKGLLQEENSLHLKVESIAYDVGFSSPSNFYTAFKKETGSTPRRFQQQMMS